MPIEIRELHIRMSVGPPVGTGGGNTTSGSSGAHGPSSDTAGTADEELVTRCVEQVLEILRNRSER